jgi:cytochrome c oxidase cbb3-type subunit 3
MSNEETNDKVVISEEDKTYLLDHDYDGIKECNYPLPFWWVGIFWGTIIFSGIYVVWYHMMGGQSIQQEFAYKMKVVKALRGENTKQAAQSGFDTAAFEAASAEAGKTKFAATCAACHGAQGQGGIGPNLTDNYWLYGNKPEDNLKVITKGTSKGMPPYGNMIKPADRMNLVKYIHSIQGSNPPGAKAPQGKEYK